MPYQVPQNIDSNKIFLVNFSEVSGNRWEADFFRPDLSKLENKINTKSTKRLRDFCLSVNGGATPKTDEQEKYYSDEINGVPFLRVQNLQTTGFVNLSNCNYINKETHNGLLKRSQVHEGYLLVKITGVGRMAISSVAPLGFVGNINQHLVAINTGSKETSEYIAQYLNLDVVEKIASRHATGGTRPALDYPSLLNIPIIENLDFSNIKKALVLKQQKEQEAQKILDSIDDYLLGELGITLPENNVQSLQDRIFTVNFSEVSGKRFDPKSVLLLSNHACSIKYDNVRLKQVATIEKGNAITSDQINPNGSYPVIGGGQTSPYNHDKFNFEGDVITVSASGAYSGFVWYHENPIFASDCSVIYSKDDTYVTKYIFEVLKAQQSQIYNLQQGAGQPHVYPTDLGNLWIPVVSIDMQNQLINQISEMRAKAKQLQTEASEILQNAKQEVERMILV